MEEELPIMNLWDGDFPSPCHSFKRPTGPPTLPSTLRRAGSKPTLPTLVASEPKKGQEVNEGRTSKSASRYSSPDLYQLLDKTLESQGTNIIDVCLAKPNMVNIKNRDSTILGEERQVPKSDSTGPPTLPATLRRAGSEPALPTFMTAEEYNRQELDNVKNSKMSSRSSAPDLCKLLDNSWPWNSGPQFSPVPAHNINKDSEDTESTSSSCDSDTSEDSLSCLEDTTSYYNSAPHEAEDAETEDTGSDTMLSVISLHWLWIHEDNSGTGEPGPEHDPEVTASISTSRDLKETDVECREETHDTIDILDIQSENPEYEIMDEITLQEPPPISSKDQPQEVATASKKKHRRGWKGVRRRISHLFSSLCCCLLTPETEDTVPRSEEQAWVHGS